MKTSRVLLVVRVARCLAPAVLISGLVIGLLPHRVSAASSTLMAGKDTTIYGTTNLSSGAGQFLLAGGTPDGRVLRSLIAFDLGGQIPAGATINSVTLTLGINTPLASHTNTVRLHRLLADWGEGNSVSPMGGGIGAQATPGDATWNARIFNTANWTTPGGDFAPNASAAQPVSGSGGTTTFSSPGVVEDVQAWVNSPASNFGWIIIAQDEGGAPVRFASRQGFPAPTLLVDYTIGGGGGNTAPAFTAQPASQAVAAGAAVTFSVSASGTPAPTFQWRKDGAPLAGATNATLTLTNVTSAQTGTYTVVASNAAGSVTSAPATLTVSSGPSVLTARLSNLSVRAAMEAGQTLIVGFSVSGGPRSILVRGVGPTLAAFVETPMEDPRLELYNGSTLAAENNNWGNSAALSAAFTSVGAFPYLPNSRDAALLQAIDSTRSVHLKGTGAGVALVELYDTGSGLSPRLVNVSARNHVGTGDNILIFGFFVDGTGTKNVLIRAVGPRLATDPFNVPGTLMDPRFQVIRADGTVAASNDNWDAPLAPTFSAVGAFGLTVGSRDAALVTALTPGPYTLQVSGVGDTTGEALVEIYEVP